MKFTLLHSQRAYTGRAFSVNQDKLQTPDGREVLFDIIYHIGSVILIPIDSQGMVYFVRQYRHAAGLDMLELPAGTLEPDEAPAQAAARELREETGMAAETLKEIGSFYLAPGYSTEKMHVFLATGLHPSPLPPDEDEFLSLEKIPYPQALAQAKQSQMEDAKTLAALLLATEHIPNLGE
jgi:ADP-ribose pyrophosphatase